MQQQDTVAQELAGPAKRRAAGSSPRRRPKPIFVRGSEAQQRVLVAALLGGIVLLSVVGKAQQMGKSRATLTPGQVITSIRTAVVSTPGRVLNAQAGVREGHSYCDVQILAADGRTRKVAVDVASNTVTPWAEDAPGHQVRRHENLMASEAAALAWPSS